MKKNRYIIAMEIGIDNIDKGISYFKLIEQLQNKYKYKFTYPSEFTFCMWFIKNFTSTYIAYKDDKIISFLRKKYSSKKQIATTGVDGDKILGGEWFIKGETVIHYYDYLKLKNARTSSTLALWFNVVSIGIAVFALFYTMNKNEPEYPTPPYDVKLNQPIKIDDESINKIRVLTKDSIKNQ